MAKYLLLAFAFFTLTISSCKKEGCTDKYACNYDPSAGKDDGSCDFSCYGVNGGTCNAQQWTGTASCNPGTAPVPGGCCSYSRPYTCSSSSSCYATCEEARLDCGGDIIYRANF